MGVKAVNNKKSSRIPAEQGDRYGRWELPEVNEGQIIHAEKTRRDIARGQAVDVDQNLVVYSKLTAGQLEEISQRIHEDIYQESSQAGYSKGHKEGYQAGLSEGQQLIDARLQQLDALIAQLDDALQVQDNHLEQALVQLATSVAQSVIKREVSLTGEHIQSVITEALACLEETLEPVTIYLSAPDYQRLQQEDVPEHWRLQEDVGLSEGGCRVKQRYSLVEFTLEDQFQQTVDELVGQRFSTLQKANADIDESE